MESAISSGEQNNNAIIYVGVCAMTSLLVVTDGTNNCTVTVYDSATAANNGKKIGSYPIPAASKFGGRNSDIPVICNNGIYCEVASGNGYGGTYFVEYKNRDINR